MRNPQRASAGVVGSSERWMGPANGTSQVGVCRGDKRFGDHRQRRWCTVRIKGMCVCFVGFGMG